MRGSLVGSTTVHVVLLAVLFAVPRAASIVVPGPDVVQVSLLDASSLAIAAPPEPPSPEPEAETIKPIEEEAGVRINPKKPPPKKPPPPDQKRAPEPTITAALPYAPAGSAGLRGEVAVDASNFEFTYYLVLVRNRIAQNWSPPAGMMSSGNPVRAVVYFRISRNGDISAPTVEKTSSIEFFDRSASRAVTISAPLPPLPLGYSGQDLGVHFGFEYSGP